MTGNALINEPGRITSIASRTWAAVRIRGRWYDTAQRANLLRIAGALFDVVASGAVDLGAPALYALADAAQAHADLEGRRTTGQLVLLPS